MKKIVILLFLAVPILLQSCSKDPLDTVPKASLSSVSVLDNAENANVALNGVYKALYTANDDWLGTQFNVQQNMGVVSHNLVADLMGEDMAMMEIGNGWFWFDYNYKSRNRPESNGWRSYGLWNFYYKLISNLNYIIAAEENLKGDEKVKHSVIGASYALRAYSYYYLTLFFCKTYKGNEDKAGVPIYITPTDMKAEPKSRGTLQEVYAQIEKDLTKAISELEQVKDLKQSKKTDVNYYVAKGIQAKVYLTMEKYEEAAAAAKEARSMPGLTLLPMKELLSGFNNVEMPGVMWGGQVIEPEAISGGWGTFFCHMDPGANADGTKNDDVIDADGYGTKARKCADARFYAMIPAADGRKKWFGKEVAQAEETGPVVSYVQLKYRYKDVSKYLGDYIFMRAEEMLLIEAEALCHLGKYPEARTLLKELAGVRYEDPSAYDIVLNARSDAATYHSDTHADLQTLMDEVLFQRRLELWCEAGRLFDLKRLHLGFDRDYPQTNHPRVSQLSLQPNDNRFEYMIPQTEFDGNKALSPNDQNPEK